MAKGQTERRLTVEYVAARALAESATLVEAAPRVLRAICEALGWDYGALWNVDAEAAVLRCIDTFHPSTANVTDFDDASRGAAFPRGVGLPGRVWASGEPAWIPDVVADANFPRASVAADEGLHGAFAMPVLAAGTVVGVMEFFSREIREPDEDLLLMLTSIGTRIGQFMERKRAEEELDRFFSLSLDMLCVADFEGYFTRLNPAWEQVLGYSRAELLAKPYVEFVHPDDRAPTNSATERVTGGGTVLAFENRYRAKDGSYRWLQWAAVPYPKEKAIYAAARDITPQKEVAETLARYAKELEAARQRAESATEAKGEFLAHMSHEIRTPLNAVMGMTSLLLLDTSLSREHRQYLATIKNSADSLLAVVNDVLDFSRIEARRLDLEAVPFGLREAVADPMRGFAVRAAEKGIELVSRIAPDVPDRVIGDPGRLRQVIVNLVGNAIKFTERGEVSLDVRAEPGAGDRVRLHVTVTDTGIGIPADKQQQIFEAFAQADASTTRKHGGTGLGLAIVSRLVALMGGTIWVDSEVGRGSAMHFTVDLGVEPGQDAIRRMAWPHPLRGVRVLVVDDSTTTRRIVEEMLASWGTRTAAADSGAGALQAIADAHAQGDAFAAVILDHELPDMDGLALARRVRRIRRAGRMPLVMLTVLARPRDVKRARHAGITAGVSKPVQESDLFETLTAVVGLPQALRGASAVAVDAPAAVKRLRVLLAEDNPENRLLVTRLLEKRGHTVTVTRDGRDALKTLERNGRFDVVLMDVQMPVMDGFEATAAIRTDERSTGRHLPIVAMTAHALSGARERCLEAGMDGYLSKPIVPLRLYEAVEHAASGGTPAAPLALPAAAARPLDHAKALALVDGDRRLLAQVVRLSLRAWPAKLRAMRRAVTKGDANALYAAAHALKGSAASFAADGVATLAGQLETMGRTSDLAGAVALSKRLEREVKRLPAQLRPWGLALASPRTAARRSRPRTR